MYHTLIYTIPGRFVADLSSMMFLADNTVLSFNFSSFSKRSLIIFGAGSIGTEVKSEVTS